MLWQFHFVKTRDLQLWGWKSLILSYLGSFNTNYIICRRVEIFPKKNCEEKWKTFWNIQEYLFFWHGSFTINWLFDSHVLKLPLYYGNTFVQCFIEYSIELQLQIQLILTKLLPRSTCSNVWKMSQSTLITQQNHLEFAPYKENIWKTTINLFSWNGITYIICS